MDVVKPASEEKAGEWAGENPPTPRRPSPWKYTLPALAVAGLLGVAYWGIHSRHVAQAELIAAARLTTRTTVATVHSRASEASDVLVLPANVQAYVETPIYSRTNGYLKRWLVDIGGKVQAGQLLAVIETPEIDEELRQAEAAEAQASANLDLAKKTAVRWQNLLKLDGVSQQEVDQNVSAYTARQADLAAARANVQRLKDMQSFQKVVAPFSGIITARNVDVGALISPGSTQPLFRLAQTRILRVYASVPQSYSRSMVAGLEADLKIPEFPGRTFAGKVARTAGAIDPASRTLLTEVQVPNPTGELLPGAYGTVQFHLQLVDPPWVLPATTLLFRSQGTQVAIVGPTGKVHLEKVVLGRDLGTQVEIVSGVKASDVVIVNPSDSIADGDSVSVEQNPGSPGSAGRN
jgi:RND family efflux transporter MFP subunit